MIILGIDAGTEKSGFCIFDTEKRQPIDFGVIPNEQLLEELPLMEFDLCSNEMIASYGMPVGKTTFETVWWIGRFCQMVESMGKPFERLYKKKDINPAICFDARAKDSNIRRSILEMFPATGGGATPQVGTKNNRGPLYGVGTHIWAALAVCLTHALNNELISRDYE